MTKLIINNLNLSIDDNNILSDINYEFNSGDFVQIFGANGSGKSSLLKCINQDYINYSGNIILDGVDLRDMSKRKVSDKISFITQNSEQMLFHRLSIKENYKLFSKQNKYNQFIEQLRYLNTKFANMKNINDVIVHELSGGQKQLLILLLVLTREPSIVIFDEHTSAMDKKMVDVLMKNTFDIVIQKNIICIMVCHNIDIVKNYHTKILLLKHGHVFNADKIEMALD